MRRKKMQIIENNKIQEKVYIEKLSNGLKVIVIPKKTQKKYIIWGVNYGSIDHKFTVDDKEITVPDGIAHYMEHKMFEQENGTNSLDVLSSMGVNANAYTTNNHTAYLFEDSNGKFYEALDEFMNYVQNPYFTDENVEKERGIIEQEIMMYDDYPDWKLYMNAMKAMYHKNPINIDVAGTKETIAEITKDTLYETYNAFYKPDNMAIVVCGDFEPENIIQEIEKRMTLVSSNKTVKRLYEEEPEEIVKPKVEDEMNISMPLFMIGYKDDVSSENQIKKDLALDIIFNILIGDSSELYHNLYEEGLLQSEPTFIYENSKTYSHILIQGQSEQYDEVIKKIEDGIENLKQNGIDEKVFDRIKKKLYGEYVKSYNDANSIATSFLQNYFRDINPLDYFEEFKGLDKEYAMQVLENAFQKEKMVVSIVKPK
jgi:predicted Zn-dependent peptidase